MMKNENTSRVALLTVGMMMVLAAVFPDPAAALKPHERDGWLLGVSLGYSTGRITLGNGEEGDVEGGATPQIRFGHMVSGKLALGLEYNGWMYEGGDYDTKIRTSLQSIMLGLTWYPGNPEKGSGGLYLRGSGGLGWGRAVDQDRLDPEPEGDYVYHGDTVDETGLGLQAALGYEFRLTSTTAAGLSYGINYLSINKDIYESGWFTPLTLTLGWYW